MKKTLPFLILALLLLSSVASAVEVPQTVTAEKLSPFQSFIKDYFGGGQTLAVTSQSYPTTINRGETVSVALNVKYQHDSEKSKFDVSWVLPDNTGVYAGGFTWAMTANQGDWYSTTISGIKTSVIPDSFCGKTGKMLVRHYNYYDGAYHLETASVAGTTGTYFNCGNNLCEEKPLGSPYCQFSDRAVQEWQTVNCQKTNRLIDLCGSGEVCENGACKTNQPTCPAGNIESPYCQDESVVQKYQNSDCTTGINNVETCQYGCQEGSCITQKCGNGAIDAGEGCETCPSDVTCTVGQACINNQCQTLGTETLCSNGLDDDSDGVVDCADSDCKSQTVCGGITDSDGDGVIDSYDNCPNTPKGFTGFGVDERGCSFVQKYGMTPLWILLSIIAVIITAFVYFKKIKKRRR